jgi:hypothetical protein
MQVETKEGGDGVRCWNVGAIQSYADQVNAREAELSARNPDLLVRPGRVKCYGCELMEYDYGVKCTAELTVTRYVVDGELEPRAADAKRGLSEIPGLLTKAPDEVAAAAPADTGPPEPAVADLPNAARFRGLFGRRS